jgi:phage gpG-like protein
MAGVAMDVDVRGFDRVRDLLGQLEDFPTHELLDNTGQLVEGQTKDRILDKEKGKRTPEGVPWKPWSEKYEKTRHENQSLLVDRGHLHDTIQHVVEGLDVEVGSNETYAAAQFYGYPPRNLPSRQALGLSGDNQDEIERRIGEWLHSRFGL